MVNTSFHIYIYMHATTFTCCRNLNHTYSRMASIVLALVFLFLPMKILYSSTPTSWVKSGYYYSENELQISGINSALFTHLICAFVYINSSSYNLSINSSDFQQFSTFTQLVKLKNPSLTTLLSIWGGREQSPIFFSMLKQSSYRKSFIESSIRTARLYEFDGIDLCGILPSTSLDMTNLGTLLDEWRATVDSDATSSGRSRLVLTMMGDYMPSMGSVTYPIEAMKRNLDWVHLKSYDYYVPREANFTNPHAALYDQSNHRNTDAGIKEWISKGMPASKLVLGLPYHGYGWTLLNPKENGIGAPSSGPAVTIDGSIGYKIIKLLITSGSVDSVYNATFVVNHCMIGSNWINFDDVEAIRTKVSYAKKMGLLGYNVFQVGNDDNWVLSRAAQEEDVDGKNSQWLLAIVLVTTALFIIILGTIMCYVQRRVLEPRVTGIIKILKRAVYKKKIMSDAQSPNCNSSNLQIFSYASIKMATNNFSSDNKLGEGGFGAVYKGQLRKGQEIAVKRLSKTSNQGLEEFKNEVTLTANLQHVNLVRVLGYCTEREEKMLVYEYMPNKSLDLYLFDPGRWHLFDWRKRVHIIEGITQGLLYLQEYSNFTIIHRDLKASNILLDDQMNARISDFGLARLFRKDECEANTGRLVGTYGYVPPEYVRKGIYSMKYDVYSFGVLLLQIISGKRNTSLYGFNQNLSLLEYAYELWKEGQGMQFIDSTLDDSSSSCKLLRCMQVALLCVQENPVDRPTMLEVSSMLKNETAAIVSPKKPAFSVKDYEDEECQCKVKVMEEMCSVNGATVSQVKPR